MSKLKKRLSVILVVTILLSTISVGLIPTAEAVDISNYANTANDTPLSIEVTTDKSSYSAYGIAEITVNVTNISEETVNNISAEAVFNDLAPVGKNNETFKEIESLKSGESFSFSYKATLNANKVKMNFFEKIILWFVRLFNGGYNATSHDIEADTENITEIKFGSYFATNYIKVWDEALEFEMTDEEYEEALELCEKIEYELSETQLSNEYKNLSTEGKKTKIETILNKYKRQGIIKEITYNDSNCTFSFEYSSGLLGGVVVENKHSNCFSVSTNQSQTYTEARSIIQSKTSVYYNNEIDFLFVFGASAIEDENSYKYINHLKNEYDNLDISTTFYDNATVSDYKNFNNFDLIYIVSHGSYDNRTPFICTNEIATKEKRKDYKKDSDSLAVYIVDGQNYFWILPSFFEDNYENQELKNSIVLLSCCNAFGDNNQENYIFANSFKNVGASAVIGFCNSVNQSYSNCFYEKLIYKLSEGNTVIESFNQSKNIIGENEKIFINNYSNLPYQDDFPAYPLIFINENIRLFNNTLEGFGTFTATVKDKKSNSPIENVGVVVYNNNKPELFHLEKTNSNGVVNINLPEGKYTCEFNHDNYEDSTSIGFSIEKNVTTSIMNPVYLTRKNTSISCTVKDETTKNPISGVVVEIVDNESDSLEPIATATTDINGWFSIELPQGDYSLSFNHEKYKYHGISLTVDSDYVVLNDPILLTRKTVSITGTVEDKETKEPISGVTIEVVDNESNSLEPLATATTDENGSFTIKIPYGDTSLSFKHNSYEYYEKNLTINSDNYLIKIWNLTNNPISLTPKSEDSRTVIDSGECGADGDNVTWTLYDDGELVISGSGAMADYYFDSMSSNLEGSELSPWYDYYLQIKEITITNNVTTIGDYAFAFCFYVTHINIPSSITRIGNLAFYYCSISTITVPENVADIGDSPFLACESLASITVSEENQFFSNDEYGVLYNKKKTRLIQYPIGSNKTTYTVPNTVSCIGAMAFATCDNLSKVKIGEGVITIESGAFTGCTELTEIIIPEKVKVIGDYALFLTGITYVNIPDSTTTIGEYAFTNCNLETIILGKSVTDIGENAFAGNPISKITVNINNQYFSTDECGVLYNKDKTTLIQYPCRSIYTKYTIPDSVITIKSNAFRASYNLTEITLGNNIKTIESACFESCENLNRLVIPDSVETIGDMAFADCGITDLVIGNSVRVIGTGAFSWCNFTNLELPESVKIIQVNAFAYNSYLVNIVIPKSVTYIGKDAFNSCISLKSIRVDIDNMNYCSDEYGVLFDKEKTILIKYPSANDIASYSIPSSVILISDYAFWSSNNLTEVIIPNSVVDIGNYAFYYCRELINISIPNSVSSIGESAFYDCTKLKKITIPDSVTYIGNNAFNYCSNLTNVYYTGTKEKWNNITIGTNNTALLNATIHYNS